MGRTATNVIGNSIATAVIAKWETARVTHAEAVVTFDQLPSEVK